MEVLVFETSLGHTALARRSGEVLALTFGHPRELPAIKALEHTLSLGSESGPASIAFADVAYVEPGCDVLVDRVCDFIAGEATDFDDLVVDCRHLTDFAQQVIAACRRIPWGETSTYGELASQVGRPGAARAVGSVMARNRVPLIVPCHRVVPVSGGLGGFSAPQGVAMKKRLLAMEQQCDEVTSVEYA